MKKVFITLFFGFILCNISFAESYYFKECQLTEKAYGDYLIDFDNNVIRVSLKATNGNYQKFTDKIKSILSCSCSALNSACFFSSIISFLLLPQSALTFVQ